MDDISYLNPEEIKEISVLKDASSSAIYGSRAAFGVLLITTKSGEKTDRIQVKYSNNFGWSQATVLPEIHNSVNSLEAMIEASKMLGKDQGEFFGMYYTDILPYARKWYEQNSGKITEYREARPYVDENNVGDYYVDENGRNFLPYGDYDINKIFMNNAAPSNQHNVSINGTTGRATFNLAFGYAKRQSLVNFNPRPSHTLQRQGRPHPRPDKLAAGRRTLQLLTARHRDAQLGLEHLRYHLALPRILSDAGLACRRRRCAR